MSISAIESIKIFERLEEIAIAKGLGWVVSDVNRQIGEGKLVNKKIRPSEIIGRQMSEELSRSESDNAFRSPKSIYGSINSSPFDGIVSKEYSPKENLVILIEALETAVSQPIELGIALSQFVHHEMQNGVRLDFASDEPGGVEYSLKPEELEARRDAIILMRSHFRDLINVIEDADS
jgi:hypothetical protein